MEWTKEKIIQKMKEIRDKGFIRIHEDMFRKDDGVVGQILEHEVGVAENNLHLADLGAYELKGMRKKKNNKASMLTLFHQTSTSGLTPNQIFDRFGYEKPSQRDGTIKRKLFTTIYGNKINSLGFILRGNGCANVDLYYRDEYLATWDLTSGYGKIKRFYLLWQRREGLPILLTKNYILWMRLSLARRKIFIMQ